MEQARTIINHLREKLHEQPPLSKLHLYIKMWDDKEPRWVFYSSDRCSTEDLAAIMFDKSIAGYYVSTVKSSNYDDFDYNITMRLELSERRKTNIDASMVQEIVKIAEKTSKPH